MPCGALQVEFETSRPLAPRACQCSFCRKHGARTVTDPEGQATLLLSPETTIYRFASRAADYVLCGRCGAYAGAYTELEGGGYATLNLNLFDGHFEDLPATPVSYEGESAETKAQRRRARWTPARLARSE